MSKLLLQFDGKLGDNCSATCNRTRNNNSANNIADLPKKYDLNYFYIIIETLRVLKIEAVCRLQSAYF